ncbi:MULTISPECIES: biotin-dependent carboxyltransferase family protein [unclassified Nocardioides]|uniref:5-oxoprolinase subunit C family protein n=1 Tax=unclassified Nocardioides TaxID=2615069 RepID=UPI00301574C2
MTVLRVRRTGPLALVEDLGRPGHAAIGVGRSGAADRAALRLANRAVGNPEAAAAIEVLLGGLELEVVGGSVTLCVTGAPAPVRVGDRDTGSSYVARARDGDVVRLGRPPSGLRSYVAVRGGLDLPAVLGSRSRDVLAGLGPEPLAEGDELPVGAPTGDLPATDLLPPQRLPEVVELRVVRGPRDGWLADADRLVSTAWTVSDESNRVGVRLHGAPLRHRDPDRQLPSEGAWRGAVQVPPGGEPMLFLADHPVTGGYPVVGVVIDADVDRAAQVRAGQAVRFRWTRL